MYQDVKVRRLVLTLALTALFAVVMIIALGAKETEAGGSGDYPPPSSGDWNINQPTSVWSESIVLRGNLNIYAPLTLNLVNLSFNVASNLQYGLTVYSTGRFTFNNANLTSLSSTYHYRFRAYNTTTIRNSELSEAYYGLEVNTKNFTMTDSKIFNMYYFGLNMHLVYTLKGNVQVKNNEFVNNRNYGIYIYQNAYMNRGPSSMVMTGDLTIQNNKFSGNLGGGIYIYRYMYSYYSYEERMFTNLTIEGNTMIANRGYGIYIYTNLYNYQGSDSGKITYKGNVNLNNNTIKDNSGGYAVYYRNYIRIYYGSDALIDSNVNMVGNTITGTKGSWGIYFYNYIYEYYGRDAKVRINLRFEANNISSNGGHGVFIDSYSNTNHGDKGVCTNDGNIVFKDNTIQNNLGVGVYLYRIAYASYAAYASITGNTIFDNNKIINNQGSYGVRIYSYAQKNRGASGAWAKIWGDVKFTNNTFNKNIGYGAFVQRYTRSYYGGDSEIRGDVLFRGNTINENTGYGGYVFYDAYKSQGETSGIARVVSNATYISNTMSKNRGAHGFYYQKRARAYYSSFSALNGTVTAEGNTIEDNKGYGIYIYAYSYNSHGALGNTYISGDIWIRGNTIRRNNGGGVYLYCYSNSARAKSADIYQNITFYNNVVTNNGYSGFVVSVSAYSNRAIGGDTRVIGDISYLKNTVNANLYNGIYFARGASADYTSSTSVLIYGDMRVENNTANSNYNYGIYINNGVRNSQAGQTGKAELKSDYIIKNNKVQSNLYWAAMYIRRAVSAYYTGTAVLDSDLLLEDNEVTGNRGTGVYLLDQCDQYYYGGSGSPDRGSFTLKGKLSIQRNKANTNAGMGIHLNSTIDAQVRNIEPAPMITDNEISYNGGDFALYCDLRDITKPITIERNTMDRNDVQFVALIQNSGTAPDILFKRNNVNYNNVEHTILGLVLGNGDYNATIEGNTIRYNDAGENVLALVSSGKILVKGNYIQSNTNATETLVILGTTNTSTIEVSSNNVSKNAGNGIHVHALGLVTVKNNIVMENGDTGIMVTTDATVEKVEARIYVTSNTVERNKGNGILSMSLNVLEITDNSILDNGLAGVRINAMKVVPKLADNAIERNYWGMIVTGDRVAPVTTTYTIQNLVIKDSDYEGFYAEELNILFRSCTITGSGEADLAVRRARIDCYDTTVGYASGNVYETGRIHVWWTVDISVKWQSGIPVPRAHVRMASSFDNATYKELDTDEVGYIPHFNVEEWSMVDAVVNRWSPYAMTASKNIEASTQVETVNRSRPIILILYDTHAPSIVIEEPREGLLTNVSLVRVSGRASDGGSGLAGVRVHLDDGEWTELGKVPAFSKLMVIPDGPHKITVQAEDVAGMKGNVTINVTVDTVLPRFMIVSPEEGFLTNIALTEVEGRVLESGLEVAINGLPQTIGSDNSFKETIRLYEGPNVIKAWARDLAGNQRLITVNGTLDTIPPQLVVDRPKDNLLTSDPQLKILGRSEKGATVGALGSSVVAGEGGAFEFTVNLTEGENQIAVTASDPAGNAATVHLHVRLDTQAPMVTIDEPPEGLLTKADKIRVAGTVEEEEGLVLSVGGNFVLPGGGRYNANVDLVEGYNVITVTARDPAGNEAQVNRTVIRRTTPPPLEILKPPWDYHMTNEAHYSIEGTTDPDVSISVKGTEVDVNETGFFAHEVELQSGENYIVVEAWDDLGNEASAVIHLILDIEAPVLILDSPYDGERVEEATINVSGKTEVGTTLTVNGVETPVDDRGRFLYVYTLKMGEQNITVVSTDAAGNENSRTVKVIRGDAGDENGGPGPQPTTGSTGLLLLVVAVIIAAAAAGGYLFVRYRRREDEEEGA